MFSNKVESYARKNDYSAINKKSTGAITSVLLTINYLIFAAITVPMPFVIKLSEGFPVVVGVAFLTSSGRE